MDKTIIKSPFYWLYIIILFLLNLSIIAAPFLAMQGNSLAKLIYNFFIPLDHQWIYRSFCVFNDEGNIYINECISHQEKEKTFTFTRFTDFEYSKKYDGVFSYDRSQIGLNRGDFLLRGTKIAYKFPVCARDTGFYLALLVGSLLYPFLFTREDYFPIAFLLLSAVPIGFDGTFQLLTSYESTVLFRFTTGLVSGLLLGILITGNIISKLNKE